MFSWNSDRISSDLAHIRDAISGVESRLTSIEVNYVRDGSDARALKVRVDKLNDRLKNVEDAIQKAEDFRRRAAPAIKATEQANTVHTAFMTFLRSLAIAVGSAAPALALFEWWRS